jgi:hypothetical protein
MNIYINTQVAKDGRAFKPGPDETTPFPNNFYVDYLRIWKRTTAGVPVLGKTELGQSDKFVSKPDTKPTRKRGLMYSKRKFKTDGMIELGLSAKGKLHITTTGELSRSSASLTITWPGGSAALAGLQNEQEVEVPSADCELVLKTKQKEYRQKFRIEK